MNTVTIPCAQPNVTEFVLKGLQLPDTNWGSLCPSSYPQRLRRTPGCVPYGREPLDSRFEVTADPRHLVNKPVRSAELLAEAVEYLVLDKISTHLTDYFNEESFAEQNLKVYRREDVPDILLRNRFLETFSRPTEQRPAFMDLGTPEMQSSIVLATTSDALA